MPATPLLLKTFCLLAALAAAGSTVAAGPLPASIFGRPPSAAPLCIAAAVAAAASASFDVVVACSACCPEAVAGRLAALDALGGGPSLSVSGSSPSPSWLAPRAAWKFGTSRSAIWMYSLRDICRLSCPAPALTLPCCSNTTPALTFMVSMMGGCPCCNFEKLSVKSSAPRSRPPLFAFLLIVDFLLSGSFLGIASGSTLRWSLFTPKLNTSCTLGSFSGFTSSIHMMFPSTS
mmetsp:Transcript_28661/g.66081  ORF Transcript_28661/g.66081 Transcript_28661/m.66081 type:complete len:233 (+) Transcript_28661:582-1280(+)